MFRQLSASFGRAEDDDDIRAVLLYGDGQDMTTGLDLMDVAPAWMSGQRPFAETDVDPWGVFGRPRRKPLVVMAHARSYTLGFELALASEACVASADAVFALREVRYGIYPADGGIERFVLGAGWSTAMRYIRRRGASRGPAALAHGRRGIESYWRGQFGPVPEEIQR